MASPEELETVVARELDKARSHEPAPPVWFVATVMRRVHAWEAKQPFWRRWRRSAKAANFSPAPRVGMAGVSIQTGGMVMKKVVWTVATLGALAIAAYVWLGYPSVGQGTDATIGAAQRYQAQPAATPAPEADTSVQAFIQTDTFDRLIKNPDTRHALQKAASEAAYRQALTDQAIIAVLARQEMRDALAHQAVRNALAQDAFMDALSRNDLKRAAAADPALTRAIKDAGLEAALADASYRSLFARADMRRNMAELAARGAFSDAALMRAMADPAMAKAARSAAFEAGLARGDFAKYLQER
jgi:hypothetical protein